jgi:hypothetical protein
MLSATIELEIHFQGSANKNYFKEKYFESAIKIICNSL